MTRLLVLLVAFAAVLPACADGVDGEPGTAAEPATVSRPPDREEPPPAPAPAAASVVVVDGDTGRRVSGARVTVGRAGARADERGVASVPLLRAGRLLVTVSAPGYIERRVRLDFRARTAHRLLAWRRALQWPLYGANPARTQVHPAIRLRPPFRTVWAQRVGSLIEFPAVVWEGVAYVTGLRGVVHAFSMRNGKVLWRTRVGTRGASSPAVDAESGTLVVTTMIPGNVNVVDMHTGKIEWRYPTGRSEPSPVIRDGVAYLGDTNGRVYALDLRRRRARWIHRGGSKITGSPALVRNRLYVGDYAGRVLALDTRTGRRVWTGSAGTRVYGTTAVAGGRVFAPSVFSGLSALSARNGRLLWRVPVGAYLYSSPAVFRGRVYFGTYAGVVYCASARTGRILWSRSAGGSVSGAVQVVAGLVYAGSFGSRITAWHWRSGRRAWRFPHGEYVPVSGNGGRLLMHGHTRIWAVEPKRRW